MAFWDRLLRNEPLTPAVPEESLKFAVDEESFPASVVGLQSYADTVTSVARVSRREAMSVGAVKRSRDMIAGSISTLPLDLFGPNREPVAWPLFEQPEKNTTRTVTMTRTVEDMLLTGVAWWRVVEFGWHTYPEKVRRLDPRSVAVNADTGQVYVNGKPVPDSELIRFDSPNDGLLIAGARAIRTALRLDAAAANMADGVPPLDYFTPAEGADPAEDEDVVAVLDGWQTARRTRSTGYVPAALKYNLAGWNPEQLQMAEARNHAVLEIARLTGIDPEELGVSTTSRTYANQFDRRKAFLDFAVGPYLHAVEQRLTMGDVSPHGSYAKFNLSAFLRSDDKTRMETYEIAQRVGALTTDEIRVLEDRIPLTPSQRPVVPAPAVPLRALPTPQEVTA